MLAKKFATPLLAEEFYESGATEESSSTEQVPADSPDRSTGGGSDDHQESSQPSSSASITIESVDTLEIVSQKISCIEPGQQLQFIEELLARYCSSLDLSLPPDFLSYSVKGMVHLQASGRSNFLYGLAKGLGTQRLDATDSLFPTKQIIAGLVEYSINFFNASTVAQASTINFNNTRWLQNNVLNQKFSFVYSPSLCLDMHMQVSCPPDYWK